MNTSTSLELLESGVSIGFTPIMKLAGKSTGILGKDKKPLVYPSRREAKRVAQDFIDNNYPKSSNE